MCWKRGSVSCERGSVNVLWKKGSVLWERGNVSLKMCFEREGVCYKRKATCLWKRGRESVSKSVLWTKGSGLCKPQKGNVSLKVCNEREAVPRQEGTAWIDWEHLKIGHCGACFPCQERKHPQTYLSAVRPYINIPRVGWLRLVGSLIL